MTDGAERLAIGRAISLTGGVIRRNIGAILAVCVVTAVLTALVEWAARAGLSAAFPEGYSPRAESAVRSALNFVVSVVTTAGVTRIALADLDGERVGAGPAIGAATRFLLPLLGLELVLALGIGLAAVLLLVPGIMLALRWAVATPARMAEGTSLNDSTRRSVELTAGNRWRILWLFVAVYAGIMLAVIAVVVLAGLVPLDASLSQPMLDTLGDIGSNTALTALPAAAAAVCYAELRRIKEGATPGQLAAVFA